MAMLFDLFIVYAKGIELHFGYLQMFDLKYHIALINSEKKKNVWTGHGDGCLPLPSFKFFSNLRTGLTGNCSCCNNNLCQSFRDTHTFKKKKPKWSMSLHLPWPAECQAMARRSSTRSPKNDLASEWAVRSRTDIPLFTISASMATRGHTAVHSTGAREWPLEPVPARSKRSLSPNGPAEIGAEHECALWLSPTERRSRRHSVRHGQCLEHPERSLRWLLNQVRVIWEDKGGDGVLAEGQPLTSRVNIETDGHARLRHRQNKHTKNECMLHTVIHFYFGSVQFSVKRKFAVSVRKKTSVAREGSR